MPSWESSLAGLALGLVSQLSQPASLPRRLNQMPGVQHAPTRSRCPLQYTAQKIRNSQEPANPSEIVLKDFI